MLIRRALKVLFRGAIKTHFSQFAEDIVLREFFPKHIQCGTYVDIGAYHPYRISNTLALWLRGWSGINVDANPHSVALFQQARPEDINIFCAVVPADLARQQATVPLFVPPGRIDTMGTCDGQTAIARNYRQEIQVPALDVAQILAQLGNRQLDFLNIDVEGLDEAILREIDFNIHRPSAVCIEDHAPSVLEALNSPIGVYLQSAGYRMKYRLGPTSIFERHEANQTKRRDAN